MVECCGLTQYCDFVGVENDKAMFVPDLGGQGQASRQPTVELGIEKGYSLVGYNGINLLFVDKELADG